MKRILFFFFYVIASWNLLIGQITPEFNPQKWDIVSGKIDTIGGRVAFSGIALLKDAIFTDGTIEWDIWANGNRSYAGIVFRSQPNRDTEEFYIRPHKANGLNADALQYAPVYHGVSCWQLYSGEGATGYARIPYNEWVHFKVSVKEDRAVISVGDGKSGRVVVERLDLGTISGRIGIKGPADGSAWFSNFRWSPVVEDDFPEPRQFHSPEPGIITDWDISQPFSHDRMEQYRYYGDMKGVEWKKVTSSSSGLVNLTKEVIRNPSLPGWIYARATIISDHEGLRKYQVGYSDYVTVFVNGRPLMSSTNAYTSRDPGFAGVIGYFDEIFLPLKKGSNEICLLIGEQFGGWGFMMRDGEAVMTAGGLKKLWELKASLNFPESVVYDARTGFLYASNFITPTGGGISRITPDGKIADLEWVTGLRNPTGITVSGEDIYVVERTGVAVINKNSGEVTNRVDLQGCIFPNDITSTDDGSLFISDNAANRIYRLMGDQSIIWMEGGELMKPNGIEFHEGFLYVGCSGNSAIIKINIISREVTQIVKIADGSVMDGLQVIENGTVIFSDYAGHLFCLQPGGEPVEIINTVSTQVKIADFEYMPTLNLLVIPGLYSNILVCYSLGNLVK